LDAELLQNGAADSMGQIAKYDILVEASDKVLFYDKELNDLHELVPRRGTSLKCHFIQNKTRKQFENSLAVMAPSTFLNTSQSIARKYAKTLKKKLVSRRGEALNMRKEHHQQTKRECEQLMKELDTVKAEWCLEFAEECLGLQEVQGIRITGHGDEIQHWKGTLEESKHRVDSWKHLSTKLKNDASVREYFFDMGETFDASVFANGNEYEWDRFIAKDDAKAGKTGILSSHREEVDLQLGGLQAVKGILSVHRDGQTPTALRVEFRCPQKIEETAQKHESSLRRLQEEMAAMKDEQGAGKTETEMNERIREKKMRTKEKQIEALVELRKEIAILRNKPSVPFEEVKRQLSVILGSDPVHSTECPSFLGNAPIDTNFEAEVYTMLQRIQSLLAQLKAPEKDYAELFKKSREWKMKIDGVKRHDAGSAHLARQYEEGIIDLNNIMAGDAFNVFLTGGSASLASMGGPSMGFVHRAIFNNANALVASMHREHERLPDNIKEKNFVGKQFKKLQDDSEIIRHDDTFGQTDGTFWDKKGHDLCSIKGGGEARREKIEDEIKEHLKELKEKLRPLRESLEKVEDSREKSTLETAILSSAQLVLANYDENGWTAEKWNDGVSGKDAVLQLSTAVRQTRKTRKRYHDTDHKTVLTTKDWKPKSKADIEIGASAAQDVKRLFEFLNDAIDTHQDSLHRSNMRHITKIEIDILKEAHNIREDIYEDYDKIKGVSGEGPLVIDRNTLNSLYSTQSKKNGPPFFDTRDDPTGKMQEQEGRKGEFTVGFTRVYTTPSGKKKNRVYDPKDNTLVPVSVKCEVCATAVIALSLLLYPSKIGNTKTSQISKKGSGRRGTKHQPPKIFNCDQIRVDPKYQDETWEGPGAENFIKELALNLWDLNSRDKLEKVWHYVWLESINPANRFSSEMVKYRTGAWFALKRGFPKNSGREDYPILYASFKKANGGNPVTIEKARDLFYKDLNEEQRVWTFEKSGIGEKRVDAAVEILARVVERIQNEYKMAATDYLKLLSSNLRYISMIYDFLWDFIGDKIEAKVPAFRRPLKAREMRGGLPGGDGGESKSKN
jgi:hypothetical protein